MLSLFFSLAALAAAPHPVRHAVADLKVYRTYISWASERGSIERELICEGKLRVPVFDFRKHPQERRGAESTEMLCPSRYRDQAVPVSVRGRLEYVNAEEFQLRMPPNTAALRVYFSLSVEAATSFPHLNELQNLTGWQLFQEDLTLRPMHFLLSPEAYVSLRCDASGCREAGPQSVFRAEVRLAEEEEIK